MYQEEGSVDVYVGLATVVVLKYQVLYIDKSKDTESYLYDNSSIASRSDIASVEIGSP